MNNEVAIINQDLNRFRDLVFIAHRSSGSTPDRIEYVQIKQVDSTSFQFVLEISWLFDDPFDASIFTGNDREVPPDHFRPIFNFGSEDGLGVPFFKPIKQYL